MPSPSTGLDVAVKLWLNHVMLPGMTGKWDRTVGIMKSCIFV